MAEVNRLNKPPPGFPEGDDVPPDAYLHMIVSKKYNIHPPPPDDIKEDEIEEGSDLSYAQVSFRDCTHLGCRCTDIVFLIFFLLFLAIVLGLALYLWRNSMVSINDHGEKCKVICYILEIPKTYDSKEPFKCSTSDKYEVKARVEDKFTIEDFGPLKPCLSDCKRYYSFESFGHNCVDQAGNATIAHQAQEIKLDSKISELSFLGERIVVFLIVLGVPIALSLIVILMYFTFNILFFIIMIIASGISVCGTSGLIVFLLIKQAGMVEENGDPYPSMSVLFTTGWVLFTIYWVFILLTSVGKKQHKTVMLTRFAAAATRCQLVAYVIVSFLTLTVIYILLILISGAIETNGKLIFDKKTISYESSNAKDVARGLLIFTYWWTNHLVIACQHLVVARVVALKCLYGRTTGICSANANLMQFHLGTACMASFIFSSFSFLKDIYEAFLRMGSVDCHPFTPTEYDMDYPKGGNCFKPISRVSYIPVCLFCEHLIPGGRKATYLFLQRHLINWRACKHFFVMIHACLLASTTIIFIELSIEHSHHKLENMMYSLSLSTIHIYFIAQAAVGLFRMVIDTLFFSYCYDLSLNDGKERPYITNPAFMQFVKDVPWIRPRKAKIKVIKETAPVKKEEKPVVDESSKKKVKDEKKEKIKEEPSKPEKLEETEDKDDKRKKGKKGKGDKGKRKRNEKGKKEKGDKGKKDKGHKGKKDKGQKGKKKVKSEDETVKTEKSDKGKKGKKEKKGTGGKGKKGKGGKGKKKGKKNKVQPA